MCQAHKQSQFTSKFIPTSVRGIFKKVKFLQDFGDRFTEIFRANIADKQSAKNGQF